MLALRSIHDTILTRNTTFKTLWLLGVKENLYLHSCLYSDTKPRISELTWVDLGASLVKKQKLVVSVFKNELVFWPARIFELESLDPPGTVRLIISKRPPSQQLLSNHIFRLLPWTWLSPPWPRTPARSGWSASPPPAGSRRGPTWSEGKSSTGRTPPASRSPWPGSRGSAAAGASGCGWLCPSIATAAAIPTPHRSDPARPPPTSWWSTRTRSRWRRSRETRHAAAASAYRRTWGRGQARRVKPSPWVWCWKPRRFTPTQTLAALSSFVRWQGLTAAFSSTGWHSPWRRSTKVFSCL